ncbi:ribbon-helix-helix domain-containing protein [Paucibacter sp. TC2R-5]|uniref:CopG family ribbon-helix-helix protein n=1 Tax=Paucibacter sp. TC2R-5 TaxID=2893555 RepID=UPI0021E37574|nr:ribbon-helix-helix domain-containing protein [Paucibacter sp. TC2R-5]MCV2357498.1 ribbon-helix-helix domain-containing protein [Paucibacter sp. TC2R-5]
MPRTIIDIPTAQMQDVDRLCKLLGISRAEAVRRALRDFIAGNAEVSTDGFGLWKQAQTESRGKKAKGTGP